MCNEKILYSFSEKGTLNHIISMKNTISNLIYWIQMFENEHTAFEQINIERVWEESIFSITI